MFATDLSSNPSVISVLMGLINILSSGIIYDVVKMAFLSKRGRIL